MQTYDQDVEYHRKRVQDGAMAEAYLVHIQLERDRVRLQVIASEREAGQALVELYRAMGVTEFPPVKLTEPLEQPASLLVADATVLESRPEVQRAQQSILQAQANVRLQRAKAKPDPDVYFGYKRNAGADTLYSAVQIDLPFRNRNQGAILSAEAQVNVARANLRETEAALRADRETAMRAYESQGALFQQLPQIRQRAAENERVARAAYREGGYELIRLLRRLAIVLPAAIVIIFGLLFATFQTVKQAVLILLIVPFALVGGIAARWITGLNLSLSASIGFIALFGVAVLKSVVMVSHMNTLRDSGCEVPDAVKNGAQDRLRPVLMTAMVASLGFIPMAVSTSRGAEVQRP